MLHSYIVTSISPHHAQIHHAADVSWFVLLGREPSPTIRYRLPAGFSKLFFHKPLRCSCSSSGGRSEFGHVTAGVTERRVTLYVYTYKCRYIKNTHRTPQRSSVAREGTIRAFFKAFLVRLRTPHSELSLLRMNPIFVGGDQLYNGLFYNRRHKSRNHEKPGTAENTHLPLSFDNSVRSGITK